MKIYSLGQAPSLWNRHDVTPEPLVSVILMVLLTHTDNLLLCNRLFGSPLRGLFLSCISCCSSLRRIFTTQHDLGVDLGSCSHLVSLLSSVSCLLWATLYPRIFPEAIQYQESYEQSSRAFVRTGKGARGKITLSTSWKQLTYLQRCNCSLWRAMSVSRGQISSAKHACLSASLKCTHSPRIRKLARTQITKHSSGLFKLTNYTHRVCLPDSPLGLGRQMALFFHNQWSPGYFMTQLRAWIPKVHKDVQAKVDPVGMK